MDSPILINSQAESSCDSLDRRRLVTFQLLTAPHTHDKKKKKKSERDETSKFVISSGKLFREIDE